MHIKLDRSRESFKVLTSRHARQRDGVSAKAHPPHHRHAYEKLTLEGCYPSWPSLTQNPCSSS
jgi:hypothetical protein